MILLTLFGAWLLGSLPAGNLIERHWRTDLSTVGSRNVGAGNARRSLGLGAGVTLAVLDGLKGLVPVVAARRIGFSDPSVVAVGLMAVAGNNWPVWRRGRGGRGLATSAGAVIGFSPVLAIWPALLAAVGWAVGGGIAGFLGWGLLPAFSLWVQPSASGFVFASGLGFMMAIRRAQGNAGLETQGVIWRILFDEDERAVIAPRRPLAKYDSHLLWVPALLIVGFPTYLWVAGSRASDLRLSFATVALLLAAASTELSAKFAFGALFRQGAATAGIRMSLGAAFRSALVGTGVARLIPAGGIATPFAMAWAIRDERETAVGAAVRATVLSYGGLVGATGVGLVWASLTHPPGHAARTTAVVGLLFLGAAGGLLAFGGRLHRLAGLVPSKHRGRFTAALVDHRLDRTAWGLLVARTVLEAATLGLTLAAYAISMAPSQVVGAFGVAQIIGGLPGAPGGLGITEAGLLGALTFFGIPFAAAAAPVLTFRVISFWLPTVSGIAAGGHAYLRRRPT